jgi:hypothetical protein
MRKLLLLLFVAGAVGTAADLLLTGHFEGTLQLLPFGGLSLVTAGAAWWGMAGSPAARRAYQVTTVLLMVVGLMGLWLHFQANMEFEREISPTLAGWDLTWKALRGAAPPSLAPGMLVYLGLLGLVSTFLRGETS